MLVKSSIEQQSFHVSALIRMSASTRVLADDRKRYGVDRSKILLDQKRANSNNGQTKIRMQLAARFPSRARVERHHDGFGSRERVPCSNVSSPSLSWA